MESIKIKCPFTRFKDDSFVYLDVVSKENTRPFQRKEVFFLVKNCTECNKNRKIEITEKGNLTGCAVIEKYKKNFKKLGLSSFIREKSNFIANILAKEFNFLLLKENLIGVKSDPTLEELFPHLKIYKENKIKAKEQSN
ncbi:MAG: hypothetical protein ACOC1P_01595 [Minisyncoccales bacterium]